uniref:Pkinase_Tyr domain-containing protein n=1 Tax=Macrostomum lignano TaxID=282301 RepID=A0A1I8IX77_9PLAT
MFEVCCGRYPFGKCDRLRYMEHICRGERDPMHDLRASESIKSLITDCWSHDPLYRPEFSQINLALNNREATHLRHSSSEPENLHRHAKIALIGELLER